LASSRTRCTHLLRRWAGVFRLTPSIADARMRAAANVLAVVVGLAVIVSSVLNDWRVTLENGQRRLSVDFGVFYCAGAVANARLDPYRTATMDKCGDGKRTLPPYTEHRTPGPIPGYEIALFRLFALASFPQAAFIWLAISTAAALAGIIALAACCSLPPFIPFLVVAASLRECLDYGQLPPLVFAALAVAAWALRAERFTLAAASILVTLLEPHIGLPVALAAFLWCPRTRLMIAGGIALLACVSIATLGAAENAEYLRVVLPAQVFAEVPGNAQYSLTWLLFFLGVNEHAAIRFAEAQYALTAVSGVVAARVLTVRQQSAAAVPLVVAAFSVIGGPYIHWFQVGMIAPLGAFLIGGVIGEPFAWAAIVLLATSWDGNGAWFAKPWGPGRFEAIASVGVLVAYAMRGCLVRTRILAAAGTCVCYVALSTAVLHTSRGQVRLLDSPLVYAQIEAPAREFSSFQWGLFLRTSKQNPSVEAFVDKLPTWIGMGCFLVAVGRLAWRPKRKDVNSTRHPPVYPPSRLL
jgi:hypothetical protein